MFLFHLTPNKVCIRKFSNNALEHHTKLLTRMYEAAPINGLINKHRITFDNKGDTTIEGFVPEKVHTHTAGSMHGSCYFKLLDDAAFFAAQARVTDYFVLTSSFNSVFIRPVLPGTDLTAKGWVTNTSNSLIVAHSELLTKQGKLVASGTGTFMKSPNVKISDLKLP